MNQPIWEETVRQMKGCLDLANDFCTLQSFIPGHFSPLECKCLMRLAAKHNGIQQVCDHAANLDMRIAVENMVNMPAILGRQPGD